MTCVTVTRRNTASFSTAIMKEILYIQAGSRANYAGTHFWNAQDSYLSTATGDEEGSTVEHEVSFREGVTAKVSAAPDGCGKMVVF